MLLETVEPLDGGEKTVLMADSRLGIKMMGKQGIINKERLTMKISPQTVLQIEKVGKTMI